MFLSKSNKYHLSFPHYGTFFFLLIFYFSFSACDSTSKFGFFSNKNKETHNNILLIAIDTLRADSVGCYGSNKSYTPNIDKIAKQSLIYEHCLAPSSWTLPSFMSLFTSLYAPQHGITGKGFLLKSPNAPEEKAESLSKDIPTLAEILSNNGYHCEGIVANMLLNPTWGFKRGFQNYKQNYQSQKATKETDEVCETLYRLKNDNIPFFLFVHYMDPHAPYSPPFPLNKLYDPDYKGSRDGSLSIEDTNLFANISKPDLIYLKALYDGEITYVDKELKRIFNLLEQSGLSENTIIIITSDHGEEFYEHNAMGHCNDLFQELIFVPLIIKIPDQLKKGIIRKAVSFIDIAPTLVNLVSAHIPKIWKGELLPEIFKTNSENNSKRTIFSDLGHVSVIYSYPYKLFHYVLKNKSDKSESTNTNQIQLDNSQIRLDEKMPALETIPLLRKKKDDKDKIMPDLKIIKDGYSIAFDIEHDPQEIRDIFNDPNLQLVMKNLEEKLKQHIKSENIHSPDVTKSLDKDTIDQLKALGYIQ
jgi:arylsulfatase A-like enzyme